MLFSGLCLPSCGGTEVCCPEKRAVVKRSGRCVESDPEGWLKHRGSPHPPRSPPSVGYAAALIRTSMSLGVVCLEGNYVTGKISDEEQNNPSICFFQIVFWLQFSMTYRWTHSPCFSGDRKFVSRYCAAPVLLWAKHYAQAWKSLCGTTCLGFKQDRNKQLCIARTWVPGPRAVQKNRRQGCQEPRGTAAGELGAKVRKQGLGKRDGTCEKQA